MASGPRAFRFGVQVDRARTVTAWKDRARGAEALGYDILLMPDHFGPQFAIGPALAIAAEATSTLRIGTLVWQNDLRHPALVAQEAFTLDILSGGRFELGIGAGGSIPGEYRRTGIPFDTAPVRVSRLHESVRVLKGLAAEDRFTFSGEHYTLAEYRAGLEPVQRPHPPLLIAAGGQRMLRLAAREADIIGVLPSMSAAGKGFAEDEVSLDASRTKVDYIKSIAGERFASIELNILIQMLEVTDNRHGAIEAARKHHGITNDAWFDSPMVYVGSVEEIANRMRTVRDRLGVSYFVIFEPVMEAFAPVVAALAGH
ncbi:MAG: TIGR03621 family F420-dependent LLM class oxidoreductase [Chloroflexota bacterium]|nr:TIGR03621 family F420-dependent LLM class oxidoreductase [Chloroflexota bacterium]